jgi:hypothetical protein
VATDLRCVIVNRPGALMEALNSLCAAGINIDSFCADIRPGERWGFMHLLVEDGPAACSTLEAVGVEVTAQHEVDVVAVEDRPGKLAEVVRGYSEAGRNIEVLYTASSGRVVLGTEDMQQPRYGVRMEEAHY